MLCITNVDILWNNSSSSQNFTLSTIQTRVLLLTYLFFNRNQTYRTCQNITEEKKEKEQAPKQTLKWFNQHLR